MPTFINVLTIEQQFQNFCDDNAITTSRDGFRNFMTSRWLTDPEVALPLYMAECIRIGLAQHPDLKPSLGEKG